VLPPIFHTPPAISSEAEIAGGAVHKEKLDAFKQLAAFMQSADECQFLLTDLLMRTSVLFCHAFTGCDTTSAFFGKGKKQAWTKLKTSKTFWDLVKMFSKPKAPIAAIERVGQAFAIARYDDHQNRCNTLDKLRIVKLNWPGK